MTFRYELNSNAAGSIVLTDLRGKTLKKISLDSSSGEVVIGTDDLSRGMYFCTLTVNGKQAITKKIAVGF